MFGKIQKIDKSRQQEQQPNNTQIKLRNNKKDEKFQVKLQESIDKIQGASFRMLNEMLYTQPSKQSFDYFKKNPDDFLQYHTGFQGQVKKWPENPVDKILNILQTYEQFQGKQLVICDLGCGDAQIEEHFRSKNQQVKVFSYDLIAHKPFIRVADIAHLPRKDNSCDIAIFSLALQFTIYYISLEWEVIIWNFQLKLSEQLSWVDTSQQLKLQVEFPASKLSLNQLHAQDSNSKQKLNKKQQYYLQDQQNEYFVLLMFRKVKKSLQQSEKDYNENISSLLNENKDTYNLEEMSKLILKPCYYKKR